MKPLPGKAAAASDVDDDGLARVIVQYRAGSTLATGDLEAFDFNGIVTALRRRGFVRVAYVALRLARIEATAMGDEELQIELLGRRGHFAEHGRAIALQCAQRAEDERLVGQLGRGGACAFERGGPVLGPCRRLGRGEIDAAQQPHQERRPRRAGAGCP